MIIKESDGINKMSKTNIKIRNIEIECAKSTISNDYFIEHFKEQGKDIDNLLKAFGKNERKMIQDNEDSTISLGINVAKKIMKSSGLTGDDIDMIIFSSQFPEYTLPTQALIIHKAIGCKNKAMVMDMNVNCVGMVVAVDNAVRYLKGKDDFKRALVIGSDYVTVHCKENDELTYPMWGDCACAVILEKTEEDCGIVGASYYTNSEQWDVVKYPECGLSNIYDANSNNDRKILWNSFDGTFIAKYAKESLNDILVKHNVKMDEIKAFCFSQFAYPIIDCMKKEFEIHDDRFIYVGDKYGYTGTSSPFLALHDAIKEGKVKRGDYVALWSVGTNWTTCALVIKY